MGDYIPGNDAFFYAWLETFYGYASNHMVELGLIQADLELLDAVNTAWRGKYDSHVIKQTAAKAARGEKDEARSAAEAVLRPMVARIQACPTTTNADRQQLGITIRGGGGGAGVPPVGTIENMEDTPHAVIDMTNRLRHKIRIQNQTLTGARSGKPAGALGAEIRSKIGDEPVELEDMQLVGVATRSPYMVEYSSEHAGKTVHYALRWITKKGEKGPWSETESATIAA